MYAPFNYYQWEEILALLSVCYCFCEWLFSLLFSDVHSKSTLRVRCVLCRRVKFVCDTTSLDDPVIMVVCLDTSHFCQNDSQVVMMVSEMMKDVNWRGVEEGREDRDQKQHNDEHLMRLISFSFSWFGGDGDENRWMDKMTWWSLLRCYLIIRKRAHERTIPRTRRHAIPIPSPPTRRACPFTKSFIFS